MHLDFNRRAVVGRDGVLFVSVAAKDPKCQSPL